MPASNRWITNQITMQLEKARIEIPRGIDAINWGVLERLKKLIREHHDKNMFLTFFFIKAPWECEAFPWGIRMPRQKKRRRCDISVAVHALPPIFVQILFYSF